ncbi:hypothetical protein SAMN04487891_104163 [Flagellimonas taeanensis]|uniref:Cytochrome C and Quinol oxidase polypeptide I n=1 Tax=Flagellimonas taeanensis TaxID=1005926 RepID=A0A1M6X4G5_9FLAO|nr:hypothetical protein [Allomuricauda taeanensis]SFB97916.1 hypothetical protein SAMN04487891_104163 [Allomuricauda taeanensis]SHL00897.1 hypothetical protein SAMN05216293_2437 [Allomuricauda taeanensis]
MKDSIHQRHIRVAISYFAMAALLGVLLRFYPIFSFGFNYRYMVHAHSHIALLGWVYVALTTLIHYCFMEKGTSDKKYTRIFWFTQVSLVGMLLTFPFQGYALFSIFFSTLFLIMSYVFFHYFSRNSDPKFRHGNSLRCIKAALWYMVISSLGPWALGIIMGTLGAQSIWYRLAIYFYLHFQYNGWMLLALIGLFLFAMERRDMVIPKKSFMWFFWILNAGVVLTFFLSTLWIEPSPLLYVLAGIGAIAQGCGLVLLWAMAKNDIKVLPLSKLQALLMKTAVFLVFIKIALQLLTALPYFARIATMYLDLTIGYLHMTFLGMISIGLFFLVDYFGLFVISKKAYQWYFWGFLVTEILIFYKGFAAWVQWPIFNGYVEILALVSLSILCGLLLLMALNRNRT